MKTFNIGSCPDRKIEAKLRRITKALGDTICTDSSPCGTVAYYDLGEANPWRISDDHESESFATAEEAVKGAKVWADAFEGGGA